MTRPFPGTKKRELEIRDMKKAEKEPPENKSDLLTPEELREMYVMVKEIHHHLGLDGAGIRSLREARQDADEYVRKWLEKQVRKKERQEKKK